jgi:hypothetical protein
MWSLLAPQGVTRTINLQLWRYKLSKKYLVFITLLSVCIGGKNLLRLTLQEPYDNRHQSVAFDLKFGNIILPIMKNLEPFNLSLFFCRICTAEFDQSCRRRLSVFHLSQAVRIETMNNNLLKLKRISETLLFEESLGKLNAECLELYDFLGEIAGETNAKETILPTGKAISAEFAARCVLDFARTSNFLRGLRLAIIEAKTRFPDEKITILYAGCGLFATLAIPLCTQFSTDEIGFDIIDIHQTSIDSAKRVFKNFGLENYVRKFIRTDAATFQAGEKFHVAITETMQKALEKEPQVAITLNLAKQLKDNGVFVPAKISVEVCLMDLAKEFEPNGKRERIYLGKIMELTKETIEFLPTKIKIPNKTHARFTVALLTKIHTFGSITIGDYDSGLTYPTILYDLDKSIFGKELTFEYLFGKNPKFNYYQS